MIPRGLFPVLMVCTTSSVSVSMTEIVLSFSLEMKARYASALEAVSARREAASANTRPCRCLVTSKLLGRSRALLLEGGALRLRFVDAERVELGQLMQETGLWRYGNEDLRGGKQDGLAQLAVPRPVRHLLTLEG